MADLNELQSSDTVKIVGASANGAETTPVNATGTGSLHTTLHDSSGNELIGQQVMADSIPVTLASDQIVTNDFVPSLKNNDRLKVEVLSLGGPIIQVSSDDQSMGYLEAKVIGTTNKIVVTTANPGGDEDVQINIGSDVFDKAVNTTDNITEGVAKLFFTDERAQDAVGNILTDTSSVDLNYNDAGNSITATVLPAGVNHNALQNYVANQHIDHSAVSISAGTGLTGGGNITANRTISMPNVGTAGTYGNADSYPIITTDTQGRVSEVTLSSKLPTYYRVGGQSVLSTTSQNYTPVTGMSLTPPAGTYLLQAGANTSATSNSRRIDVAIEVGGVLQTDTETTFFMRTASGLFSNSSDTGAHAIGSLISVDGTQAVTMVWETSGGTAEIGHRFLHLIKV